MLKSSFSPILALAMSGFSMTVAAAPPPEVWTSLPPIAWLARQVAGDTVVVKSLLKPGQNPHTYSPRPKELVTLKNAIMYLHCGTDFEEMLARKIHAMSPSIDVENIWDDHATKAHTPAAGQDQGSDMRHHDHDCGSHTDEMDPHVWMSPVNLMKMARDISDLLTAEFPENKAIYAARLAAVMTVLTATDKTFAKRLTPVKGTTFYVYHPAFGHFAHRYGLTQKAVEVGGKSPTPKQLMALITSARKESIKTIIASPQFSDRSSEILARKIGGTVVKVNPLDPNPLDAMRQLTDALLGVKRAAP